MAKSPVDSKTDSKSPLVKAASPPTKADPDPDPKSDDVKDSTTTTTDTQPLAPPPRPGQPVASTPDYFSSSHGTHLSYEQNPFEHSFAGGSAGANTTNGAQTPGGTKLPPVAALASPSVLLTGVTPSFWGGLRSGPLSPAMLSAPQKDDYFGDGHHLRGGFPTPNESGLRSGLTPGGGGSMFPEPSPSSQALFSQLASGGATPSTLDFHRTAMSAAAAAQKRDPPAPPHTSAPAPSADLSNGVEIKPPPPPTATANGQFDQHDANDAANGLFLLAQARNGAPAANHYAMAQPHSVHAHPQPGPPPADPAGRRPSQNPNGAVGAPAQRGMSELSGGYSDDSEITKPVRTKGKKPPPTNGRRKADESPVKGHASKKSKQNNGTAALMEPEPPSEEEPDMSKDEYNANGKKMTDEEKRKNFLERNRVAALKCRQRKKQWLANLQQKVEIFSSENDALNAQISSLREEVVNLKTLLLAHKDCPVSHQQGLNGMAMHQVMEGYGGQMNPYAMQPGMSSQQVMAGQPIQRRFS